MRWALVLCVVLAGCEAVVVRCPADRYCKNRDIETCQVKCDRDGNNCEKLYSQIDCPGTCTETANGAACIDNSGTCNSTIDKPRCDGDSIITCINDRVSTSVCPIDKTCFLDRSGTPFCVDKPITACDPASYPVCVDTVTVQQCIPGATSNALLTGMCTNECITGYCN